MLTWFDIIILTIITASSLLGIYGGLIKIVIGLLGFVTSIIITYYLSPYIANIISGYFTNIIPLIIISVIISYIISLMICSILTHKFLAMVAVISKGIIDRLLGLAAGFTRGTIICLLLFESIIILLSGSYLEAKTLRDIFQNATMDKYPSWLQNSITTPYLDKLSNNLINSIPLTRLESIKLPDKLGETNFRNVLEKSHSPNTTTLPNIEVREELDQQLDEILTDKNTNND